MGRSGARAEVAVDVKVKIPRKGSMLRERDVGSRLFAGVRYCAAR